QRIGRGVAGEHDAGRPLTLVPRGLCIRAPAGGQGATGQRDGGRRRDDLGESLHVTPRLIRKVRLTLNTLAAPGQVLSMAYLTWGRRRDSPGRSGEWPSTRRHSA